MTAAAVVCVAAAETLCWLQLLLLLLWALILQLRPVLLRLVVPAPPVTCLPAALTVLRVPFLCMQNKHSRVAWRRRTRMER